MVKMLSQLDHVGRVCLAAILIVLLMGVFAPWIAPHDPTLVSIADKFKPVSADYWLGTDQLGRCVFSRLIFGIRATVFTALLAMILTISIGGLLGLIAGYFGGRVDSFLMRLCDMIMSFPGDVMILAIVGILGPSLLHIIGSIVIIKWAWYARIIRGAVRRYKNQNFILFARVHRASFFYILRKHLLPCVTTEVLALVTINIGGVVLMISALSFLGLGIQAPTPEWGTMLSEAKNFMTTRPYLMLPPGLAITLIVIAFNYLGDSLQDRLTHHAPAKKSVLKRISHTAGDNQ